ncbi:zinc finger protein 235-like [Synchiropus splendidus]|uniref:zinc finger protein 235-like n=1 Tax=Synchiropus splendidus TaxID=270530 RepID=UPI00237ECF86|nr:zinc finger protein 235-like [Synchiropus splendidus]
MAFHFQAQLASIMEVLANSAVAEICQLVDEGFASLRLEISRSQRENLALKSKLRLLEVQADGSPQVVVTCSRKEHQNEDSSSLIPQQVTSMVSVKKESVEEELQQCSMLDDYQRPLSNRSEMENFAPSNPCDAAESHQRPQVDRNLPATNVSPRIEEQQPMTDEGDEDGSMLNHYGPAPELSLRDVADLTKDGGESAEEQEGVPGKFRTAAEREPSDRENDFWREAAESTSMKFDTSLGWSEADTAEQCLGSAPKIVCVNSRRDGENNVAHSGKLEADNSSFDSSSFDDLFSSPDIALSLSARHKGATDREAGLEDRSSSYSYPVSGESSSALHSDGAGASSRERLWSCTQCNSFFSSSRDLRLHQRAHSGERVYHCQLCMKAFAHQHQLKTHQRVHTGEKPFSCAQCGKRFSQSSHIKRHMSVHTGEKPFSCNVCGRRFSQSCTLKVHQAVHTGERPYSCTKCGKSFSVLGNLVRHQSVHINH